MNFYLYYCCTCFMYTFCWGEEKASGWSYLIFYKIFFFAAPFTLAPFYCFIAFLIFWFLLKLNIEHYFSLYIYWARKSPSSLRDTFLWSFLVDFSDVWFFTLLNKHFLSEVVCIINTGMPFYYIYLYKSGGFLHGRDYIVNRIWRCVPVNTSI